MYLIDYVRNNPDILPEKSQCPVYSKSQVIAKLEEAVCINSQNVADYFQNRDKEKYDWTFKDIPYAKPPFPTLWMEYREYVDGKFLERLDGIKDHGQHFWGHLFLSGDGKHRVNVTLHLAFQAVKDYQNKILRCSYYNADVFSTDRQGIFLDAMEDNTFFGKMARWINQSNKVAEYYRQYDLNEKTLSQNKAEAMRKIAALNHRPIEKEWTHVKHSAELHLLCSLLTFSFMNCKNVATQTAREAQPTRSGINLFTNKKPEVKVYTLVIDPLKKLLAKSNGGNSQLTAKALHICRGHFKDFSHGAGLFGKYRGTYWWPATIRGDKKYGEVIKDYKVLAAR